MDFQAAGARVDLISETCGTAVATFTRDANVYWQGIAGLENLFDVVLTRRAGGRIRASTLPWS